MNFLNPTSIISILIAISVHEAAHAFTANRLGDPTPGHHGRLTLNPLAHLDMLGALMFLFVGFGWAKPVPVNPAYFRQPKLGMALTALAGPASNLVLALLAYIGLQSVSTATDMSATSLITMGSGSAGLTVLVQILGSSLFINLALMAFNLFPIAPLDGSNILQLFIPYRFEHEYQNIQRYGTFILLFLLIFESSLPFPLLSGWVYGIVNGVLGVFRLLPL